MHSNRGEPPASYLREQPLMKLKSLMLKVSVAIAPLLAALSMGGPAAEAKGAVVIVGPFTDLTFCGPYTTAQYTDLSDALAHVNSGTILVCPGVYGAMAQQAAVTNSPGLTIKR